MDKDSWPKRYFWRRVAAFTVDFLLAYVVAMVVLIAVDIGTGGDFYYWGGVVTRTTCQQARPSPLLDQVVAGLPVPAGWSRAIIVCEQAAIGGKAAYSLTVADWIHDGRVTKTSRVNIPVTASGDQFDPSLKLDPTGLLAYIIMIVWAWRFARTPGKKWLGLVVKPEADADDVSSQRLRRELFRLVPLSVGPLFGVVFAFANWLFIATVPAYLRVGSFMADNVVLLTFSVIAPLAVLGLLAAAYYLFPFMRWRGQTFYDRLAGTLVVRG